MAKRTLSFIPAEPSSFQGRDGQPVKYWAIGFADGTTARTYSEKMVEALRPHLTKEIEVTIEGEGDKAKLTAAPGIYEAKGWSGGGRAYQPRSIESFFAEEAAKHSSFAVSYVKDLVVAGKVNPDAVEERVGFFFGLIRQYHKDAFENAKTLFKFEGGAPSPTAMGDAPSATPPSNPPSDLKKAAVQALNAAVGRNLEAAKARKDALFQNYGAWEFDSLTEDQLRSFVTEMEKVA